MIKIKDHKSLKYCSDYCDYMVGNSLSGYSCSKYKKKLMEEDKSFFSVVLKRTPNCLKARRYKILPI